MESARPFLLSGENDELTTAKWNGLVKAAIARGVEFGPVPPSRLAFAHPFQVTVMLDPADTNTEARRWRVRTNLGCVNDVAAAIVYRATEDPRGWQAPERIDPLKTPLVDRTMLETDDPPYFLLTTPAVGHSAPKTDDFQRVADTARPAFFRTLERWQKDIYVAHVAVTAEATAVVSPSLPAVLLSRLPTRYRLVGGRLPVATAPQAGGQQEIAQLYLLRDPEATDATGDVILVRQLVFWDLASVYVQPANPLDGFDYGDDVFGTIAAGTIADLYAAGASVQWWTM